MAGISNRESPQEEAQERQEHPPVAADSPGSTDSTEIGAEEPADDLQNVVTSRKAGSRSSVQKDAESRHPDSPMPATNKVEGAFGKEPNDSTDSE